MYDETKNEFEKARSIFELDVVFDSFMIVIERFMRCNAYEDALDTIQFIEKSFQNRSDIKGLKDVVDKVNN